MIDIDYTGSRLLCAAIADLRALGITIATARLSDDRARGAAERTGLFAELGPGRDFKSVHDALQALLPADATTR